MNPFSTYPLKDHPSGRSILIRSLMEIAARKIEHPELEKHTSLSAVFLDEANLSNVGLMLKLQSWAIDNRVALREAADKMADQLKGSVDLILIA